MMKQQDHPIVPAENQVSQDRNHVIAQHVIHTLGRPTNLRTVQVRFLWENRYRVNIFTGVDVASTRVANSYFLTTDNDGNIIDSIPEITRQY